MKGVAAPVLAKPAVDRLRMMPLEAAPTRLVEEGPGVFAGISPLAPNDGTPVHGGASRGRRLLGSPFLSVLPGCGNRRSQPSFVVHPFTLAINIGGYAEPLSTLAAEAELG